MNFVEVNQILNNSILLMIALNTRLLMSVPVCERLYSSLASGSSFSKLAYCLKGYSAPVLILILNTYVTI